MGKRGNASFCVCKNACLDSVVAINLDLTAVSEFDLTPGEKGDDNSNVNSHCFKITLVPF